MFAPSFQTTSRNLSKLKYANWICNWNGDAPYNRCCAPHATETLRTHFFSLFIIHVYTQHKTIPRGFVSLLFNFSWKWLQFTNFGQLSSYYFIHQINCIFSQAFFIFHFDFICLLLQKFWADQLDDSFWLF